MCAIPRTSVRSRTLALGGRWRRSGLPLIVSTGRPGKLGLVACVCGAIAARSMWDERPNFWHPRSTCGRSLRQRSQGLAPSGSRTFWRASALTGREAQKADGRGGAGRHLRCRHQDRAGLPIGCRRSCAAPRRSSSSRCPQAALSLRRSAARRLRAGCTERDDGRRTGGGWPQAHPKPTCICGGRLVRATSTTSP